MIFPIGDTQIQGGHRPLFAYTFIAMNIMIFIIQMITPGNLVCEYATIPQDILQGKNFQTLLTSMFLHGGWMHIIGNMLFLWVFADNIEAVVGSFKFLVFYILGGVFASFAHIYFDGGVSDTMGCCVPCGSVECSTESKICSGYIPSLGASGAISAVMGAYLVMFPKSKIKVLLLILFTSFHLNAWIFLLFWFGQQLFAGIGSTINVQSAASEGVAWWAHIGGFVFGIAAGYFFKKDMIEENTLV